MNALKEIGLCTVQLLQVPTLKFVYTSTISII
jgi:hypothetical protein